MSKPKKVVEEIEEILEPVLLESILTNSECDDDCTYKGLKEISDKLQEIIEKITTPSINLYQSLGYNTDGAVSQKVITDALNGKQPLLECGVSIKTINGECLLGPGDIVINPGASCHWRVGDVIPSFSNRNPSLDFEGTVWELACKGKALIGVDLDDSTYEIVGSTFGAKTHAITIAELPSHNHPPRRDQSYGGSDLFLESSGNIKVNPTGRKWPATGGNVHYAYTDTFRDARDGVRQYATTGNTGGGQAIDMHQPSIVLYMWKRIS